MWQIEAKRDAVKDAKRDYKAAKSDYKAHKTVTAQKWVCREMKDLFHVCESLKLINLPSDRAMEKKKKALDRAQEMLHKLEVAQTDKVCMGRLFPMGHLQQFGAHLCCSVPGWKQRDCFEHIKTELSWS